MATQKRTELTKDIPLIFGGALIRRVDHICYRLLSKRNRKHTPVMYYSFKRLMTVRLGYVPYMFRYPYCIDLLFSKIGNSFGLLYEKIIPYHPKE